MPSGLFTQLTVAPTFARGLTMTFRVSEPTAVTTATAAAATARRTRRAAVVIIIAPPARAGRIAFFPAFARGLTMTLGVSEPAAMTAARAAAAAARITRRTAIVIIIAPSAGAVRTAFFPTFARGLTMTFGVSEPAAVTAATAAAAAARITRRAAIVIIIAPPAGAGRTAFFPTFACRLTMSFGVSEPAAVTAASAAAAAAGRTGRAAIVIIIATPAGAGRAAFFPAFARGFRMALEIAEPATLAAAATTAASAPSAARAAIIIVRRASFCVCRVTRRSFPKSPIANKSDNFPDWQH